MQNFNNDTEATLEDSNQLIATGYDLVNQNELDRALECYEKSLEIRKKINDQSLEVAESLSKIANIYFLKGDYDRAIKYHIESLNIRENISPYSIATSESLNDIGIAYNAKEDKKTALSYLNRSLKIRQQINPQGIETEDSLQNIALISSIKNDLNKTIDSYKQNYEIRKKLDPMGLRIFSILDEIFTTYFALGEYNLAYEYADNLLKLDPQNKNVLMYKGLSQEKLDKNNEALETFLKLLCLNPDNDDVRICIDRVKKNLGLEYFHQRLSFEQAKDPNSPQTAICLFDIGRFHILNGNKEYGLGYYIDSLEILKKRNESHLTIIAPLTELIADILLSKGDLDRALKFFEESLEIRKSKNPSQNYTAILQEKIGNIYVEKGDINKALEFYKSSFNIRKKLQKNNPELVSLVNIIFQNALKINDLETYNDYSNEAISLDPNNKFFFKNKAMISEKLGRNQAALHFYTKALQIDPKYEDAINGIKRLELKMGYKPKESSSSPLLPFPGIQPRPQNPNQPSSRRLGNTLSRGKPPPR